MSKIAPHERTLEEVDEDRLLGIPLELRNSEAFGETLQEALFKGTPGTIAGIGAERRIKSNK